MMCKVLGYLCIIAIISSICLLAYFAYRVEDISALWTSLLSYVETLITSRNNGQ